MPTRYYVVGVRPFVGAPGPASRVRGVTNLVVSEKLARF